jgi:hypothetical protein
MDADAPLSRCGVRRCTRQDQNGRVTTQLTDYVTTPSQDRGQRALVRVGVLQSHAAAICGTAWVGQHGPGSDASKAHAIMPAPSTPTGTSPDWPSRGKNCKRATPFTRQTAASSPTSKNTGAAFAPLPELGFFLAVTCAPNKKQAWSAHVVYSVHEGIGTSHAATC